MRYSRGKPKGCAVCHREKQRIRGKLNYNPAKVRAYAQKNRARISAYHKAWRAANRPRSRQYAQGQVADRQYAALIATDPCVYCGKPSQAIDHVRALAAGGSGEWMNFAPVCNSCNSRKHTADVLHFMLAQVS